jgi:cell division septation protein DedD/thioredoxin-related protein
MYLLCVTLPFIGLLTSIKIIAMKCFSKYILTLILFIVMIGAAQSQGQVDFIKGGMTTAKSRAIKEGKLYMAFFYTDWCLPCKWMEDNTFKDKEVADFLNKNYLSVKVNIDDFDGHAQRTQFNVEFLPTIIVFDQGGGILGKYEESLSPKRFLELIQGHRFDLANKAIKLSGIPSSPKQDEIPKSVPATQTKDEVAVKTEKVKEKAADKPSDKPVEKPVDRRVVNKTDKPVEKNTEVASNTKEPESKKPDPVVEKPITNSTPPTKPNTNTSASIATADDGKYYSVQVGTFNRFENADQRRNEFKEIFGDGVHIKIEKSGSETIYKVMIGRYKAYDAAKPLVNLLKEQGYEGFVKEINQ